MPDALDQLVRQLDEQEEARRYRGRVSYSKRQVDLELGELSDDDRLAVVCRRVSGLFEHVGMVNASELMRRCAKLLELGVAE
jgi:hypothetical protein